MRAANCERPTLALVFASVAAEDLSPRAKPSARACGVVLSPACSVCSRPSFSSIIALPYQLLRSRVAIAIRLFRHEITDGAVVFMKVSLRDALHVRRHDALDVRGVITIKAPVGDRFRFGHLRGDARRAVAIVGDLRENLLLRLLNLCRRQTLTRDPSQLV